MISERTGLLLDPYFSGTKLNWILDNVEGARDRADTGDLLFGTVDSFLIWKFTNGEIHATDATNAARTMLYDIREGYWSKTICRLLNIPTIMLPEVKNSADNYGKTHKDIFGTCIPIRGVSGDQQAAMIGQACFEPGMMKATYGTGCFALLNTGFTPVASKSRLLTTIAYQFNGQPTYALEGSIFVAGAVVQWLRDSLKIIKEASETEQLAIQADESQKITIVPAFVGLGAPHWNSECRGAVFGLTRSTGAPEMARAALESVGFQTRDLLEAMSSDWHTEDINATLRVDGGMSSNDWAMKFLSDIIGASVDRSATREATALGVAWLAGMEMGVYPDQFEFSSKWTKEKEFKPTMNDEDRERKYVLWKRSVEAALSVPI
jgi:glycerol kinase